MNYNIILVYFILSIIVVVKGEITSKSIPLTTVESTATVVATTTKYIPTKTVTSGKTINSYRKYCTGYRNIDVLYDNKDFVCRMYDYETESCRIIRVNEVVITSIHDDCNSNASQLGDGVYDGFDLFYNDKCSEKVRLMNKNHITDLSVPIRESSNLFYSDPIRASSIDQIPLKDSLKELAKKYCKGDTVTKIEIGFNSTDFACGLSFGKRTGGGCGASSVEITETAYSTLADPCFRGKEVSEGVYSFYSSKITSCNTEYMKDWSYYVINTGYASPKNVAKTVVSTTKTILTTTKTITTTTKTITTIENPIKTTENSNASPVMTITTTEKPVTTIEKTITTTVKPKTTRKRITKQIK